MVVREVTAAQTLPLRCRVLRPGYAPDETLFGGEMPEDARHFAAFDGETIVGAGFIVPAPAPFAPAARAWQLRGMAVESARRGQGVGARLVRFAEAQARAAHIEILWCNARRAAVGFYDKLGFEKWGEEFDIPTVGPHFVMGKRLELMTEITYLQGDASAPSVKGPQIIAHVCNDLGGWGRGFVLALSKRFPEPERAFRAWHRERANNDFGLGAAQLIPVGRDLWVANMIGQHGKARKGDVGPPPVRYDAIERGLARVGDWALEHKASVHMPRIGCGLAGGKWERIEPLILQTLCERGVAVWVYDYD